MFIAHHYRLLLISLEILSSCPTMYCINVSFASHTILCLLVIVELLSARLGLSSSSQCNMRISGTSKSHFDLSPSHIHWKETLSWTDTSSLPCHLTGLILSLVHAVRSLQADCWKRSVTQSSVSASYLQHPIPTTLIRK